jgi:hypothetical protein
MTKIAESGVESGYISRRHGSTDPDADPHQNVDPQQWLDGGIWSTHVCEGSFEVFYLVHLVRVAYENSYLGEIGVFCLHFAVPFRTAGKH